MGFKVKFGSSNPTLTIKSSAAATGVGTLSDVDTTDATAKTDGATLIYDSDTKTYKQTKIFTETDDGYKLDGGKF